MTPKPWQLPPQVGCFILPPPQVIQIRQPHPLLNVHLRRPAQRISYQLVRLLRDEVGIPRRHVILFDDRLLPHDPLGAVYHIIERGGIGCTGVELRITAARIAQCAQERRDDV